MAEISNPVAFGDIVRIKQNPETIQAGIAGLEGTVYGFTTPSITRVVAVGSLTEDFALNVHVDSLDQAFWLDPSSIEFVERPEVMELSVGGKTFRVTQKAGEYNEDVIDCAKCAELRVEQSIRSPGELRSAISVIRSEIEAGTLSEVPTGEGNEGSRTSFSQLLGGTLDDIVLCRFRCNGCGQQFDLSCETYHGSGGTWSPLPRG